MGTARVSLGVFGFIFIVGTTVTLAAVWLLLTDPVTVADAVSDGEVSPFAQALAGVLIDVLRGLLRYL